MEDPEQMGYIHLDRFLPVMSRWEISCFIFLFFCIQSYLTASNICVGCGSDENYLNFLNHRQDHPSREVLACCSRRSLGGIPGEGGHICRSSMCACVGVCEHVRANQILSCSCPWWQPQALDVDNTGHIDKEILTQIFTEEGEAFSEVVQVFFSFLKKWTGGVSKLVFFRRRCKSSATLPSTRWPSRFTTKSLFTFSPSTTTFKRSFLSVPNGVQIITANKVQKAKAVLECLN